MRATPDPEERSYMVDAFSQWERHSPLTMAGSRGFKHGLQDSANPTREPVRRIRQPAARTSPGQSPET